MLLGDEEARVGIIVVFVFDNTLQLLLNRLSNIINLLKMEINASKGSSSSFIDKELEAYNCEGNLGLRNHNNGKEVLPYLSSIITTDNFVLFKVSGKWGIMDRELSLILPPLYDDIYAARKKDTDAIINRCHENQSGIDVKIDLNNPQQIVFNSDYMTVRESDSLSHTVFDRIGSSVDEADTFIALNNDGGILLEIENNKIKIVSSISNNSFYWLWHYKGNAFIISENRKTYGYSHFINGKFEIASILIGFSDSWYSEDCDGTYYDDIDDYDDPWGVDDKGLSIQNYSIKYCPQIIIYNNDFISFCLPTVRDKEGNIINLSGKWALYRFVQNNSHFQQLTPFVLEKAPLQINDGFAFICNVSDRDFVIYYCCGDEIDTSNISFSNQFTIDANSLSSLFVFFADHFFPKNVWTISTFHEKIELQNDGSLCVSDCGFYGLYDCKMKELVPINYDYPIIISNQLNIVYRKGLKGVINSKGELIVPCIYSHIQISDFDLNIYDEDSYYNDEVDEVVTNYYIHDRSLPKNAELLEEDYIIAGINPEKESENEGKKGILIVLDSPEFDARVDLYLPNGQQLTSCVIEIDGRIQFYRKCGCVLIRPSKNDAYIYYINTKKETNRYSQIEIINSDSFMVYQNHHVGILSVNENVEDPDVWLVPCVYSRMSFPRNDLIFAIKQLENDNYLEVIDRLDNYYVKFSTKNYVTDSYKPNSLSKFTFRDAPKELKDKLFKDSFPEDDFIYSIRWFPVEEYYPKDEPSYNYDPYESYSTYDSLMDGLDGEPDAYWNIK